MSMLGPIPRNVPLGKLDHLIDELIEEGRINEEEGQIIVAGVAFLRLEMEQSPLTHELIRKNGVTMEGVMKLFPR